MGPGVKVTGKVFGRSPSDRQATKTATPPPLNYSLTTSEHCFLTDKILFPSFHIFIFPTSSSLQVAVKEFITAGPVVDFQFIRWMTQQI